MKGLETLSVDEVRSDPKARVEAEDRTSKLNDEFVAQQVQSYKDETDEITRPERQSQRDLFDLWEGYRDFSKKEDWQNRIVIEKPFTAVEQATAQIQRALLESPEFMKVTGTDSPGSVPVQVWQDYLRKALDICTFTPKFIDSVQMSFIANVSSYIKPRWRSYPLRLPSGKIQQASFLHLSVIPPWRIYRDSDSVPREPWSGSFLIHSEWTDKATLKATKGTVNLDKVEAGMGAKTDVPEDKGRIKEWKRSKFRKAVMADEFWGDLRDEDGDVILPDAWARVVGNVTVKKPVSSPIWSTEPTNGRRRWPFVAFSPFTHPLRFEGRGILQQSYRLAQFYENLFNIAGDGMLFSVFSGLQGDLTRLVNPTDTAIRPSKFWGLKGGAAPDALKMVETGRIDLNAILAFLQHVDQTYQNNSFVSDFVIGLPGYRSDITKGEVQLKTAQSLSIFDRMGKSAELGGKQIVELSYDMLVQFTDETTMPIIGNSIPPDMLALIVNATPDERWNQMRADLAIEFSGISQAIQRDQQLARGMQVAALIKDEMFVQLIENPADLLKKLVDLIGFPGLLKIRDQAALPPQIGNPMGGQNGNVEASRAPTDASIMAEITNGGGPSFTPDGNMGA